MKSLISKSLFVTLGLVFFCSLILSQAQASTLPALNDNGFLNDAYIIQDHGSGSYKVTMVNAQWTNTQSVTYSYHALDNSTPPKYSYNWTSEASVTFTQGQASLSEKHVGTYDGTTGKLTVINNNGATPDGLYGNSFGYNLTGWPLGHSCYDYQVLCPPSDMFTNQIGSYSTSTDISGVKTDIQRTVDNHIKLITKDNSGNSVNSNVDLVNLKMADSSGKSVLCGNISIGGSDGYDDLNGNCSVTITNIPSDGASQDVTPEAPGDGIYSYSVTPLLDCGHNRGTGDIKFVFMKGSGVQDFKFTVNGVINNGFAAIDPYKTYINKFSFYTDTKEIINEKMFADADHNENSYEFGSDAGYKISGLSSCGGGRLYFYYSNLNFSSSDGPAYTFIPSRMAFFQDVANSQTPPIATMPFVPVHESGHAFGLLMDEYLYADVPMHTFHSTSQLTANAKNCTINPRISYAGNSSSVLYGATNIQGCTWISLYQGSASTSNIVMYRPSDKGLMNSKGSWSSIDIYKFNTVDCGYILTAINGGSPNSHFAECNNMDVVDKGVKYYISKLPQIKINTSNFTPGSQASISGSGFSSTNNTVEFRLTSLPQAPLAKAHINLWQNILASAEDAFSALFGIKNKPINQLALTSAVGNSSVIDLSSVLGNSTDSGGNLSNPLDSSNPLWFIVNGIPSADGKTLNFTVPLDMVFGTYNVRAASTNSDFSDPVPVSISNPGTGPFISSINPNYGLSGSTVTLRGINFSSNPKVVFGGLATTTPISSLDTSLTFNVPSNALASTSYQLKVITSYGQLSNIVNFMVNRGVTVVSTTTSPVAPTSLVITSLSATSSSPGAPVTIFGTNFGSNPIVTFGSLGTISIISSADTIINFYVPSNAVASTTYAISVITSSRLTSNAMNLTVTAGPNPELYTISPISGQTGTAVTINGRNFGPSPSIKFGNLGLTTVTSASAGAVINFVVPTGVSAATTYPISVVTNTGLISNALSFSSTATTSTSIPATLIRYTCPTGSTLSGSMCTRTFLACTASIGGSPTCTNVPFPATAIYSCPTGYTVAGAWCNLNITIPVIPVTSTPIVPTPIVVTTPPVTTTSTTTTVVTPPSTPTTTTVPATVSYTCSTGTLSGSTCTITKSTTTSYTCPTSATLSGSSCITTDTVGVSAAARYVNGSAAHPTGSYVYSCTSGYTLRSSNNRCYKNPTTSSATANQSCPAGYTTQGSSCTSTYTPNPTYSCPTGYSLNSTAKTCSKVVSENTATSSTANVWDAIVNWFGRLFK